MVRCKRGSEVVYVERSGDASAKWLFWGALLGASVALLYAPRSGEETRRVLQRKLWKLRAMTEEKLDELTQQFGGVKESLEGLDDDEEEEELFGSSRESPALRPRAPSPSAREELERRLAETRSRRRAAGDYEEPLA